MQQTMFKKTLSFAVCMVLVAAMALFTIGCSDKTDTENPAAATPSSTAAAATTATATNSGGEVQVKGEGATVFTFTVTDATGVDTVFEVHTDKTTVGEALQAVGLIEGEEGPYGLYVKTVNGITLDYDKDGKYWAFYENGAYAQAGVDVTDITAGVAYAFKAE